MNKLVLFSRFVVFLACFFIAVDFTTLMYDYIMYSSGVQFDINSKLLSDSNECKTSIRCVHETMMDNVHLINPFRIGAISVEITHTSLSKELNKSVFCVIYKHKCDFDYHAYMYVVLDCNTFDLVGIFYDNRGCV